MNTSRHKNIRLVLLHNNEPLNFTGILHDIYDLGISYNYKFLGRLFTINVPFTYPYYHIGDLRIVYGELGNTSPTPLLHNGDDYGAIVNAIHRHRIVADTVKSVSMQGKLPNWLIWAVVGIAVIVLIFFLSKQFNIGSSDLDAQPTNTATLDQ